MNKIHILAFFIRPSIEYEGVPSFPNRVIFASTWYLGPGLESTQYTRGRGNNNNNLLELV